MEENKNRILWIRRIITLVIDLFLAGIIAYWRFTEPPYGYESISLAFALSDGFFVVGFINAALGALFWISTTGVLDIITFGFKSLLYLFTPLKKERGTGGYYEYLQEKKEKRKPVPFEILWIGLGMLVVGIILNFVA